MDSKLDENNKHKEKHANKKESFRNCGIFTSIRPLLQPPVKTRFQTFITDLKETTFKSYWTNEVGSHKDTTGKLPPNIDKYSTTFGMKTKSEPSVKSLMHICENEMSEEQADYWRRRERMKHEPKPKGKKEKLYNPYGSIVDCCMHIKPYENLTVAENIQANFVLRTSSKLGESRTAYEFPPESITYRPRQKYYLGIEGNFADNLSDLSERRSRQEFMGYLNSLRIRLKYCFTNFALDFSVLYSALRYYDEDRVGWIPYSRVCDVCKYFRITFDKKIMGDFLTAADILKNDFINYRKFVDLLNWQESYPDNIKLNYYT